MKMEKKSYQKTRYLGNCKKCECDSRNVFDTLCCKKFKKMQMIKVFEKKLMGGRKLFHQ